MIKQRTLKLKTQGWPKIKLKGINKSLPAAWELKKTWILTLTLMVMLEFGAKTPWDGDMLQAEQSESIGNWKVASGKIRILIKFYST